MMDVHDEEAVNTNKKPTIGKHGKYVNTDDVKVHGEEAVKYIVKDQS